MRNNDHLKPEWQENEFYKAYLKAKEALEANVDESKVEVLEEALRQAHLDWVYDRLNKHSKIDFHSRRQNGKGFFIS